MAQIKDADVSDDSDIHGVPKVPGQSSEDLAKQAFLQVIGIMKNVLKGSHEWPRNYEVHFLPNVYRVMFRQGSHITVIA